MDNTELKAEPKTTDESMTADDPKDTVANVYEALQQVNDRESFVFFIKVLSRDFDENHDDWENRTIADYLESISAWIKDSNEEFEHIDYRKMAEIFYAGKIYE